jgi:hypothetical protein
MPRKKSLPDIVRSNLLKLPGVTERDLPPIITDAMAQKNLAGKTSRTLTPFVFERVVLLREFRLDDVTLKVGSTAYLVPFPGGGTELTRHPQSNMITDCFCDNPKEGVDFDFVPLREG